MHKTTKTLAAIAASLALGWAGCEHDDAAHGGGSHEYQPEHGGQVVHLADHGPMVEVVHDGTGGTIKLFVYDEHHKPQKLATAPVANLEDGPTQVTATGSGTQWTFAHEKLKGHPHVAFRIEVDGKVYNNDKWHPPE